MVDEKFANSSNSIYLRFTNLPKFFLYSVFSYSTVRHAKIHSLKVAILFRFFQILIIGYIIGWDIVHKKGYQETDAVSSTVTSKVKGLGYVINKSYNATSVSRLINSRYITDSNGSIRIFDTADYVIPPSEYNSIFIMSNFAETQQTQGICDEDYTKVNCVCKTDNECIEKSLIVNNWNGIPTGKCINSSTNESISVCQVASWCPVEREPKESQNIIQNVENYTIFIKNDIQFQLFNRRERNLLTNITNEYISTCHYSPDEDPFCPVFTVKYIMEQAENDPKERLKIYEKGGVIQIKIDWQCDYDKWWNPCQHKYSFSRFDLPFKDASAASGFNFRYAEKFQINGILNRILIKAYGLRLIITVTGKAGKFSMVPLLLSIGSGIGLLSLATIIADCFLLNCTNKKKLYQQLKELDHKNNKQLTEC